MGGFCSKSSVAHKPPLYANGRVDHYASAAEHQLDRGSSNRQGNSTPLPVLESVEKQLQEPEQLREQVEFHEMGRSEYGSNTDDFYDGIPRFTQKSRSTRSTQGAVAKVSEVSSRLGRAGSLGLGKAVEVLDTLGSSMTNLNAGSGFVSGVATKGNEISILAFEVANTIVKGSNLMQSLSKRSIRHLKEVVLPSEGVQLLVSKDMDELLRIVAADKREELKTFSEEVVRFGNRCKDPQWHNLDRYFEKHSRELTPQKQLKGEAESVMLQLMTLVQYTAELYHELHALDIFEQDYQRKRIEAFNPSVAQKGDSLTIFRAELKSQRKQVRNLKKKSLWSRSLEEVMEKLVDIVHFIHREIHDAFGSADSDKSVKGSLGNHQILGPAGLALHYANIIMQIDTLVARSSSMPPNTRDALYQCLPPRIKSALRTKISSFHVKEELTVAEIKAEMEKTLQWLVPIATNTAKAHHGFGWVGEWANTESEVNRNPSGQGQTDVIQIETLHHADKEKTEAYILELVLWLHHLVNKSKPGTNGVGMRSPIKSPLKTSQQPKQSLLTVEDKEIVGDASNKKRTVRISKSEDFDSMKTGLREHHHATLSKSSSYSSGRAEKDLYPVIRVPVVDFGVDKKQALDIIDRVDNLQKT